MTSKAMALAQVCLVGACVRGGYEPRNGGRLDGPGGDRAAERLAGDRATEGDRKSSCESWGSTALFCEDMDAADGALPASMVENSAKGELDTIRFSRGRASLHITTQQISSDDPFVLLDSPKATTTVTSGAVFLRAYFYFPSQPVIPSWAILMESRAKSSPTNKASVLVGPEGRLSIGLDGGSSPEGPLLPVGRWFCMELEVDVAGSGGARAWLDGHPIAEVMNRDMDQGMGHGFFRAGILAAAQTPGLTLNVDDFVVTRSRPGCI